LENGKGKELEAASDGGDKVQQDLYFFLGWGSLYYYPQKEAKRAKRGIDAGGVADNYSSMLRGGRGGRTPECSPKDWSCDMGKEQSKKLNTSRFTTSGRAMENGITVR